MYIQQILESHEFQKDSQLPTCKAENESFMSVTLSDSYLIRTPLRSKRQHYFAKTLGTESLQFLIGNKPRQLDILFAVISKRKTLKETKNGLVVCGME